MLVRTPWWGASALAVLIALGCSSDAKKAEGTGTPGNQAGSGNQGPGTMGNPGGTPGAGGATGQAPGGPAGEPGAAPVGPFEALTPPAYAAKVKTLLTGRALTADELQMITADPAALRPLIDAWVATPEWKAKTIEFFKQAFQQTQTDINDYDEQLGRTTNPWNGGEKLRFVRAVEESFARTAMKIVEDGRPFTEVVTTERFMLNVPLLSTYAFIDAFPQNDDGNPLPQQSWVLQKYPMLTYTRVTAPVIPFEESVNPASPNFMTFYDPNPYQGNNTACVEPVARQKQQGLFHVADFMFGGRPGCGNTRPVFTQADWDDWRMVTIRRPKAAEERTLFWDITRLRDPNTTELVVATPRVGFMTTLAFFANWPTNTSNSYRVTTNQALIVALGRSFDDRDTTVQVNETSVDDMHVMPGTTCYGCHQTLDPMRDFFRQTYSIPYGQQLLRAGIPATATFAIDANGAVTGNGIGAFAKAVAQHPSFAPAWVQKLCQYANAAPCSDADPEMTRVAEAFRASNFDYRVLVRELFSSPLVTFAKPTKTAEEHGTGIGIMRRETLCASLEARLGVSDLCGLRAPVLAGNTPALRARVTAANLASSVPGSAYSRGDDKPLMPHDPNLFFAAATENLCTVAATLVVDAGAQSRYRSAQKDEAIRDFVATVMSLPANDPRAPEMTKILMEHHAQAAASGVSATEALRSTFTLACTSPFALSTGI